MKKRVFLSVNYSLLTATSDIGIFDPTVTVEVTMNLWKFPNTVPE